jgi:hypothetical protein
MSERFLVLHALRIKGMATDEALLEATGLEPDVIAKIVAGLADDGLARILSGRITGAMLTTDGRPVHAELLAEDVAGVAAGLAAGYEGFLPFNGRFKDLSTRWQLRPGGEPNDHSDAGYDAAVVAELGELHDEAVPALSPAEQALPRFGRYPARMAGALARVRAGEVAAFARPLAASYHDVWMELHEDFLVSLGRERDSSDGH